MHRHRGHSTDRITASFVCKMICLLVVMFYGAFIPRTSDAEPLFFDPITIQGLTVYRDHEKKNLFYHAPGEFVLKTKDDRPLFRFALIGYIGTARTQDQGVFKDKGVLTFTVREELSAEKIQRIEKTLRKEQHPSAELRRLPIDGINAKLLYERVSEEGAVHKGSLAPKTLEGDEKGEEEGVQASALWSERSYLIPLNDLDSNFFWKAFQEEQLVLSLSYSFTVSGMDEEDGDRIPAKRDLPGALPIRVSPKKFPELFEQVDLGAKMQVGYTHLDVYCFDFVNQSTPELYSKAVEVRYEDLRGEPVSTRVEFNNKDVTYKHSVDFPYAKKLNKSYDYRVILVNKDGEIEQKDWVRDNADSFLDITSYVDTEDSKPEESTVKKRRDLY